MMGIDSMPAAQATEALIHQYGRLVFRVIYGLTGDWHESQDLTQDTFVQAFKAIEAARQASGANFHAKAWLLRIAVNNARMSCRRRRLVRFVPFSALRKEEREEHDDDLAGERLAPVQPAGYGMGGAAENPADLIAERDAVQRTIAQLPETLRLCLLLDLGEAAVRQRLSRARRLFRALYLRESGEAITARYSLTSQAEARDRRLTLAIRSSPVRAAAGQ